MACGHFAATASPEGEGFPPSPKETRRAIRHLRTARTACGRGWRVWKFPGRRNRGGLEVGRGGFSTPLATGNVRSADCGPLNETRDSPRIVGFFRAPVEGTRQGKTVLVQLHDAVDPATGGRYTLKRYESKKVQDDDSWKHAKNNTEASQSRIRAHRPDLRKRR